MGKEFGDNHIVGVTSPVGLGHRYYLETVISELSTLGGNKLKTAVFDPSEHGSIFSKALWMVLRKMYELGAQGGTLEKLYKFTRTNSDKAGLAMFLTSIDARVALKEFNGPILSDHALGCIGKGFLIQGDVWAEGLYAKTGADMVFVPVEDAAKLLKKHGLSDGKVRDVGGFIVSSILKNRRLREDREAHLREGRAYVSFFGTGASARPHYEYLQRRLLPGLKPLIDKGSVTLNVFTGKNSRKAYEIAKQCTEIGLNCSLNEGLDLDFDSQVNIVYAKNIKEAVAFMVRVGCMTDIGVGMVGEKVGWPAAGIYFQPLYPTSLNAGYNQEYLIGRDAISTVEEAESFPEMLEEDLKTGARKIQRRLKVANEIPIEGAQNAARIIYDGSSLKDSLV